MTLMQWLTANPGVLGTLIGTMIGAVLSFLSAFYLHRVQTKRQLRIARMCVTNDLRHWLSSVDRTMDEVKNFEMSDGNVGSLHEELPDFRFEATLDQVALLDSKTASKLFDVIADKNDTNIEVGLTTEMDPGEEV